MSGNSAYRGRSLVAIALFGAGLLLLAGCGTTSSSAGVASLGRTSSSVPAGGTATTLPSGANAQKHFDDALKYSQCMRSHGVADFPDPNTGGGISISSGPASTRAALSSKQPGRLADGTSPHRTYHRPRSRNMRRACSSLQGACAKTAHPTTPTPSSLPTGLSLREASTPTCRTYRLRPTPAAVRDRASRVPVP